MVGDDDVGGLRTAQTAFDEAGPVMGTGGIDAFTAPVGQLAKRNESGKESGKTRA